MIIAIGNIHVLSLYQGIDGAVPCLARVVSREIIMPLCDLGSSLFLTSVNFYLAICGLRIKLEDFLDSIQLLLIPSYTKELNLGKMS